MTEYTNPTMILDFSRWWRLTLKNYFISIQNSLIDSKKYNNDFIIDDLEKLQQHYGLGLEFKDKILSMRKIQDKLTESLYPFLETHFGWDNKKRGTFELFKECAHKYHGTYLIIITEMIKFGKEWAKNYRGIDEYLSGTIFMTALILAKDSIIIEDKIKNLAIVMNWMFSKIVYTLETHFSDFIFIKDKVDENYSDNLDDFTDKTLVLISGQLYQEIAKNRR